jgi:hypothetical protein
MAGRPIAAFLLAFLLLGATLSALSAQQTRPDAKAVPSLRELETAVSRYYEKPLDILQFLARWEQSGGPGRDAIMGFLAGVFVKHPAEIQRVTSAENLGRMAQAAVVQGLRLADRYPEALGAAAGWGWPQNQIEQIIPVRPLRQAAAEHPSTFDVLWAASFATGDEVYVRPIFDYYAATAGNWDIDVRDIVTIAIARHRPNKDAVEAIAKKYPRETTMRIVFAASALWSLESNARQHRFVADALDRYAKGHPHPTAERGLNELRAALARP